MTFVDHIQALLTTTAFGRALQYHQTVASTNTLAAAWAEAGAAEGSVVLAEYQTQGRGRLGRAWQAAAGQNLMFSVVLRPVLPPDRWGLITLAAGVALVEALQAAAPALDPRIKWPNDVLLGGRKCCGMLLEASHAAARTPAVILGVGLNVNQAAFPPALAETATSLLRETGHALPRAAVLAGYLNRLERTYATLFEDGGAGVRARYTAVLHGLQTQVHFRQTTGTRRITGTVLGITEAGALRLAVDGAEATFHAGEISFS